MKKILLLTVVTVALLFSGCSKKGGDIGEDKAKEIALSHAGVASENITFSKSEKERDDNRLIYDIEFYSKDSKEYDYEIDAATGEILSYNSEDKGSAISSDTNIAEGNSAALSGEITAQDITDAKAKEIALAKVPGAKESDIREFEKERDDGKDKYEGKIYYEKQEYEFEIDARSGEIIKWEVEPINN